MTKTKRVKKHQRKHQRKPKKGGAPNVPPPRPRLRRNRWHAPAVLPVPLNENYGNGAAAAAAAAAAFMPIPPRPVRRRGRALAYAAPEVVHFGPGGGGGGGGGGEFNIRGEDVYAPGRCLTEYADKQPFRCIRCDSDEGGPIENLQGICVGRERCGHGYVNDPLLRAINRPPPRHSGCKNEPPVVGGRRRRSRRKRRRKTKKRQRKRRRKTKKRQRKRHTKFGGVRDIESGWLAKGTSADIPTVSSPSLRERLIQIADTIIVVWNKSNLLPADVNDPQFQEMRVLLVDQIVKDLGGRASIYQKANIILSPHWERTLTVAAVVKKLGINKILAKSIISKSGSGTFGGGGGSGGGGGGGNVYDFPSVPTHVPVPGEGIEYNLPLAPTNVVVSNAVPEPEKIAVAIESGLKGGRRRRKRYTKRRRSKR